jgi:hypothetical protein
VTLGDGGGADLSRSHITFMKVISYEAFFALTAPLPQRSLMSMINKVNLVEQFIAKQVNIIEYTNKQGHSRPSDIRLLLKETEVKELNQDRMFFYYLLITGGIHWRVILCL